MLCSSSQRQTGDCSMEHTSKATEEGVSTPHLERQQPPRYSFSSIIGLFAAHFLGAFNDNFYKIVVLLFAVNAVGSAGGGGSALSLIGAIFVLPFLLFSGYAGYVSDVYSKRTVLIVTKTLEIAAMSLGFVALLSG